jgi:hypothetical protein
VAVNLNKNLKVLMDPTAEPKAPWIGNKILKVLMDVNSKPEGLLDPKNQILKV